MTEPEHRAPRIAVLIDADNASADHAAVVFKEVANHGEANVRRIYGDFSGSRLKKWQDQLQPLAIMPRQQFNYTTGKNAADITLVIEAMDLLHGQKIDLFCLVTSDSDFTHLALRLREEGRIVFGFGERKTPAAYRNACNRFIYFENLYDPAQGGAADQAKKQPPSKAVPLLNRAVDELADDEGWARLGPLGQRLIAMEPDFDPRNYGVGKLSDLVKKTEAFSLDKTGSGGLKIKRKTRRKAK